MLPWCYVEEKLLDKRKGRKQQYYVALVSGFIFLIVISLFFAPLIHELFHILMFNFYGCYYTIESILDLEAAHFSELQPFCGPGVGASIVILAAGVVGNSILSFIFFIFSWRLNIIGKLPFSNFMMFFALGFLSDPLAYLFRREGDLVNILVLLEMPDLTILLPVLGIILLGILTGYLYRYISECLQDYMSIREEVKDAKEFVRQIKKSG